jgi:AcrR family transcriptional regulator
MNSVYLPRPRKVTNMSDPASAEQRPKPALRPRPQRGRPRRTPHPTATLLLETAVELLDSVSIDELTIPLVLEQSGVSYGSLYHHYSDISNLVEQAVVHRFSRNLQASLEAIRTLSDATDAADFRARTEALIQESIKPERRDNRLERIGILGAIPGRPRLVDLIANAQQTVTDQQAELIAEFQQRGWLRTDVDPEALSGFVQAMLIGRVVDDVTQRPVDPLLWNDVAMRAFRAILFPD